MKTALEDSVARINADWHVAPKGTCVLCALCRHCTHLGTARDGPVCKHPLNGFETELNARCKRLALKEELRHRKLRTLA